MSELLEILLNVLAPIFLLVGAAAWIGQRFKPDPRAVSNLLVYLFVPALSFKTLYQLEAGSLAELVTGEFGRAFLHITLLVAIMSAIALGLGRAFGLDRRTTSAFTLASSQMNAGNYGIPLCTFAFGPEGGALALLFYVSSSISSNMVGTFVASSGSVGFGRAAANVLRVPTTWGALLAITLNLLNAPLPLTLERAVFLASDATLPAMLALLGLLLGQMSLRTLRVPWRWVFAACGLRLIGGAVLGALVASGLGFGGLFYAVAVTQSSVPTAVLANALAAEFGSDAQFTSAATLISTLASLGTMTILIAVLR
jgi:hypothetical protein